MALSALRARVGVGASRMILNAAVGSAGRTTGNSASRFTRTLKVVGDNSNIGKIRRFSDIAGIRFPDKITANTTRFGEYCFAFYLGGIFCSWALLCCLSHMVSERRDREERSRYPRYDDDDVKHDDVLQFGSDNYVVDAMDSPDLSQWQAEDDRKIAQLEAEVAQLRGAVGRFDLHAELAELREELLRAGTAAEAVEIRERYDELVEGVSRMSSQWRAAADVKLAEFNREIRAVRGRIQEVERKHNEF